MLIPTWVLVAVSIDMSAGLHVDAAPHPFDTQEHCQAFQKVMEEKTVDFGLVAYGYNCVEVGVDDHDTSDDPKSKALPKKMGKGPKLDT